MDCCGVIEKSGKEPVASGRVPCPGKYWLIIEVKRDLGKEEQNEIQENSNRGCFGVVGGDAPFFTASCCSRGGPHG